jgi:hypothetical protein
VAPVIKAMISSKSGVQNVGSRNGIHGKLAPRAYQEDTGRKDQGWALLDRGSVPQLSDKDGPRVADVVATAVSQNKGTCKASSK